MVSSRPPRSFEEFVASQGMGVPPMKGITPSSRTNPSDQSGYVPGDPYRPTTQITAARGAEGSGMYMTPCAAGYKFDVATQTCVIDQNVGGIDGYRPTTPGYDAQRGIMADAYGCPAGYYLASDGRTCLTPAQYAP